MSHEFLTTWLLAAPRQAAWDVLADVRSWPGWWRGVERVEELDPGDERRVGSRYLVSWRAPLGYRVRFEFAVAEVAEPGFMRGHARGDLEGTGTWRLCERDGVTRVTYAWEVSLARAWMRVLQRPLAPAFTWSHDRLMRHGGEGLARRLGTALLGGG